MEEFVDDVFRLISKKFRYNPHVVRHYYEYREPFSYRMNKVPLGKISGLDEIKYLNFKKSKRILVIGSTGAGKTTLISGLFDRLYMSGAKILNVDVKGEYVYKYRPLQHYYRRFILKNEEPTGINIMSFYPVFFSKITNYVPGENEAYFQFSLRDISKFDLISMLQINDERAITAVEKAWFSLEEGKFETWEEFLENLKYDEDIHPSTRKTLLLKLQNLVENKVIGDEYDPPKIADLLNEGITVNINIKGITQFSNLSNPATAYIAIILRRVYNMKVFGELNRDDHHVVFLDELPRFCPSIGNNPAKQEVLKLLDLSRSEKISLVFTTQDYKRIPDTILRQVNYVLIPYKINLEEACEIFKSCLPGEYTVPQTFKSKIAHIIGVMKKYKSGERDWLLIDKDSQNYYYVRPLLPLSYLKSEE